MKKILLLVTCTVFLLGLFLVSCQKQETASKDAEPAQGYGEKAKDTAAGYGEKAKEAAAGYGEKAKEAVAGYGEKAKYTEGG